MLRRTAKPSHHGQPLSSNVRPHKRRRDRSECAVDSRAKRFTSLLASNADNQDGQGSLELRMPLPTSKEVAETLLDLAERASRRGTKRLLVLTPEQMHSVTGRKFMRGTLLKSVEGMLHRKSVYLLSNREVYVLAPFGALTRASPKWLSQ